MRNNNNIQLSPNFPKKTFPGFFLQRSLQLGFYGLDSPGVIYCYLLLRSYSQKLESQKATASKGKKLRPKAENKGGLLGGEVCRRDCMQTLLDTKTP